MSDFDQVVEQILGPEEGAREADAADWVLDSPEFDKLGAGFSTSSWGAQPQAPESEWQPRPEISAEPPPTPKGLWDYSKGFLRSVVSPVIGRTQEQVDKDVSALLSADPAAAEHLFTKEGDLTPTGEGAWKSLMRGVDQAQALGYGLGMLGSDLVGADRLSQWLYGRMQANEEEARANAPVIPTFTDIGKGYSSGQADIGPRARRAATYAVEALGENIPTMLPSLLGGGLTGVAAKHILKKQLSKEVIDAALIAAERKIVAAQAAGVYAGAAGVEAGSIYQDMVNQGTRGPVPAMVAAGAGMAAGVLDAITPFLAIRRVGGAPVKTPVEAWIRSTLGEAFAEKGLVKLGAAGFESALVEGSTEYIQTAIEQAARLSQDPKVQGRFWDTFWNDYALQQERRESAIKGAIVGGAFGAGGEVAAKVVGDVKKQEAQAKAEADLVKMIRELVPEMRIEEPGAPSETQPPTAETTPGEGMPALPGAPALELHEPVIKPEHAQVLGPDLTKWLSRHVSPERLTDLRTDTIQGLAELAAAMPSVDELVRLAKLGESGSKWYQLANGVITAMAGKDAWRLAGLLAATSPNKGVPDSIPPALRALRIWNEHGRPSDPEKIRNLVWRPPKSNQYKKPIYLETDLNNAIAVLSSQSYEEALSKMSASSPKVKPFYRALMGDLDAVVNDTIMARIFGIDQSQIGQVVQNMLATVWTKEVARRLGWAPAEAQAAMWAAGRTIGTRIRFATQRKKDFPALKQILSQPITTEDLMPKDDLASLLVKGHTTKEGRYHDYPKEALAAGLDVARGQAAYAELERGLISQRPGTDARAALGARRAVSLGRRLEAGYTGGPAVLREGQQLDDPDPIIQISERLRKAPKGSAEAKQLELALGLEISRRVPPVSAAWTPGGPDGGEPLQRPLINLYSRLVAEDLSVNEKVDIIGKEIHDVHQAAVLFALFRDPRFETFRFIFTKQGKIVGEHSTTCRRPGSVVTYETNATDSSIKSEMRALKADGYYVLHNHPSGDPTPSQADITATFRLASGISGFRGHVVIDHQRYSVIDAFGQFTTWKTTTTEGGKVVSEPTSDTEPRIDEDPLLTVRWNQPMGEFLGKPVRGRDELADVSFQLRGRRDSDMIGLLFTDSRHRVRGLAEVSQVDILNPALGPKLRELAVGLGARFLHGYAKGNIPKASAAALVKAYRSGLLTDLIIGGVDLPVETANLGKWLGEPDSGTALANLARRIAEEPEPYGDVTKQRKFGLQVAADQTLAPEVRAEGARQRYTPIPNQVTVEDAMAIIEHMGPQQAMNMVMDEKSGLPDRVRVTVGEALIKMAEMRGDHEEAVRVVRWLSEYGTRLGQGVQAFSIFTMLTPEGLVHYYRREIDRLRDARAARKGFLPGQKLPPEVEDKLPKFDEEFAARIIDLASKANALPAGFQRDEAWVDILGEIARKMGINKWDVATSLWYAYLLSGWTTQARNLLGTLSHLLAEFGAHAAARPSSIPQLLAGLYQGFGRGVLEAWNVVRTGKITGTRIKKLEVPRTLELRPFKKAFRPMNAWKFVFRFMAASDMALFRSAEEMHARYLARTLAKTEGLRGEALKNRMSDILHNSKAHRAAAEAQAKAEGLKGRWLKGRNYRRRVHEIMEQARPEALVSQAADYGRFATYNQEPDGALGVIARMIANGAKQLPPIRLVVPFTHVVANVGNAALNYTPWGYKRLFNLGNIAGELAPEYGTEAWRLQAARATLGTLGLTALYAAALAGAGDDDPQFAITAEGPADPKRRNQLRETGWRPYSVKIGDTYYPYQYSVLGTGLALIGNLLDASKYKKLDEADALNRAYYTLWQVPRTIVSQSFLVGLADFFEALSRDASPKAGVNFPGLARTTSSFLVPNIIKQIDKLFDPTVYDASTIQAALLRDLPVARQSLKPMLNVLGQPVQATLNPFFSGTKSDQLWLTLGRKGLYISVPDKQTHILDRTITPDEYYAYVRESGPRIRARLEPRMGIIEGLDRETAQDYIDKVVREERKKTKMELFGSK